jgi:hypothetical protein
MRKILTLAAVVALAGCGGGGGGSNAPAPTTPGGPTQTQGKLVTPTFTLVIPKTTASKSRGASSKARKPLSVAITLVSNNGTPTTVSQPTVATNVNGSSGVNCTSGCTISGPPSPPGTDVYTVATYDATNTTGSALTGNVLSTATKSFGIVAGSANTGLTITLFGVVASVAISGVPTPTAGTTPADTQLTVQALDADGGVITGTYGDDSTGSGDISTGSLNGTPVTVSINETNANGATLVAGGSATQNTTTSVTLHSDADTVSLHYAGLAENQKTITGSATGATSGTATFQPTLQAIAPTSGTEIDLYVPGDVGGTGSSGSQTFTEAGFTGTYAQSFTDTFTETSGYSTACSSIATISQGTPGVFTVTAVSAATPPVAGSCTLTVNDGLTQAGHTSTASTIVTYTTSSIGASSKKRRN